MSTMPDRLMEYGPRELPKYLEVRDGLVENGWRLPVVQHRSEP